MTTDEEQLLREMWCAYTLHATPLPFSVREAMAAVLAVVRAHDGDGERLREAIAYAGGCFAVAEIEGWSDALADGDIERIRDLWNRRLSFALEALREAR